MIHIRLGLMKRIEYLKVAILNRLKVIQYLHINFSELSILSKIKPSHHTPKNIIVDFDPAWVDSLHLLLPCKNVPVPKRTMRLPNAPRTYRSGIHRGIDFFANWGTPVNAVASGTIVRADHN